MALRCAAWANAIMIQTKIQYNLKTAKQYFREHLGVGDYYSEGRFCQADRHFGGRMVC